MLRLLFAAWLWLCVTPALHPGLFADTVVLVDDNRLENVKVIYQAGRVNVVRPDGGIQSYVKASVRQVIRSPVQWDDGLSEAEFARRMEKRIAEVVERIQSEEQRRFDARRSYIFGAAARAAALPGWHKMNRGDFFYGASVAVLALSSLVFAGIGEYRFGKAQAAYDDLSFPASTFFLFSNSAGAIDFYIPLNLSEFQQRRLALNRAADRFNLAVSFAALLWVVNLAEALIFASGAELATPREAADRISESEGPAFTLTTRGGDASGIPRIDVSFTGRF